MITAYLGLGSNIGNRKQFILQAIEELKHAQIRILKTSTIIETKPVGGPKNQENFLNAVIKIHTTMSPEKLLTVAQHIENELGRIRTVKDGPRTIDIDILLYNDISINTKTLTIPHPRMREREFVIKPLQEIAPHITL